MRYHSFLGIEKFYTLPRRQQNTIEMRVNEVPGSNGSVFMKYQKCVCFPDKMCYEGFLPVIHYSAYFFYSAKFIGNTQATQQIRQPSLK